MRGYGSCRQRCVFAISFCLGLSNPCVGEYYYANSLAGKASPPLGHSALAPTEKKVIDIEDMFSLYDLGGMADRGLSVSPDGKTLAFQMHRASLEENDYEVGWYVLDLTKRSGPPVHVGEAGDPLLFRAKTGNRINGSWDSTDPVWSPDSRWIAYRRLEDGSVQVWRSSIDGHIQEQLTESDASVDAFYWSKDGRQIWFETDATPEEQAKYWQSKTENGVWGGNKHLVAGAAQAYTISPYEVLSGRPRLWVLDLLLNRVRQASEDEIRGHFESNTAKVHKLLERVDRTMRVPGRPLSSHVAASFDGEQLAWLESQRPAALPNHRVYARLGRTDKLDTGCEFDECLGQIGKLWWSRDGREVVFNRREGPDKGRHVFYAWNIDDNAIREIYAEESRHLSACSSTGQSLICFSDEGARPRILVEVQFADGSVTELFDPNPQFGEVLVGEAELVDWTNALGMETYGWLIKPVIYEKGKRFPLVIVQYTARSCFKGGVGAEYPPHLFAAEGFVVLCFDEPALHDAAESSTLRDFLRIEWKDNYAKRLNLSSLESAIDLLEENGLIDPTKVGITGLSSGAENVSYAVIHSDLFAAAAVADIPLAPTSYFFVGAQVRAIFREIGYGRPGSADDKNWSGMSVGMNAGRVQTPILLQASDDEARASMFHYVTLREHGKAVDMYVFADEYHIKWHPRNKKAVAERAVDWMRFWLKGEERSDPAKTEQYARWRKMREEPDGCTDESEYC